MKHKIYHGSNNIIAKPIYGYGKKYNDYGLGFYCTEDLCLAKEWAVSFENNGYANIYEIDDSDLKILDLTNEKYCILNWLAILLDNREFDITSILANDAKEYILNNFLIDYLSYDIIIGFRADDSYFSFAQDFLNGTISYRQLKKAMYLGNLGIQYVIKSKKAFDMVKYLGYEIASYDEFFYKKENRDKNARREYFDSKKNKRLANDIYIIQIIDEEMKSDDIRLR